MTIQQRAGNRATARLLRSVLGKDLPFEGQSERQRVDRDLVERAVRGLPARDDERTRNTREILLRGIVQLYVGTPRWNSDAEVDPSATSPEAKSKITHIAYLGTDKRIEAPLFDTNGVTGTPRAYDRHSQVRPGDIQPADLDGYSDGRSSVTVLGPSFRNADADHVRTVLRHEVQHAVDETEALFASEPVHTTWQPPPGAVADAQRAGMKTFITEQRAYGLEGRGESYSDLGLAGEFDPDRPARANESPLVVRVGAGQGRIPADRAKEVLKGALIPAALERAVDDGSFWSSGHKPDHYNAGGGIIALVRRLLLSDGYPDFTRAWLLDDLWAPAEKRTFQHAVLRMRPASVNPLNSPRVLAVTQAVRRGALQGVEDEDDLWNALDKRPINEFSKALAALDRRELAFLFASPAFGRLLLAGGASAAAVDVFTTWAAVTLDLAGRVRRLQVVAMRPLTTS